MGSHKARKLILSSVTADGSGNWSYTTAALANTIKDFKANSSVVQFDTMAHAAHVGPDVVISVDANNSLSLHNTLLSQLTANNFHLA